MANKVTLPREVAEAIEFQRSHDHGWLLYDIGLMNEERHSSANKTLATIYKYYTANKETYFTALVNGYTVEQSPEEKVAEFFFQAEDCAESAGAYENDFYLGQMSGIETTLDLLGIKIEGVNTDEGVND